jgi:hypothetical protein
MLAESITDPMHLSQAGAHIGVVLLAYVLIAIKSILASG